MKQYLLFIVLFFCTFVEALYKLPRTVYPHVKQSMSKIPLITFVTQRAYKNGLFTSNRCNTCTQFSTDSSYKQSDQCNIKPFGKNNRECTFYLSALKELETINWQLFDSIIDVLGRGGRVSLLDTINSYYSHYTTPYAQAFFDIASQRNALFNARCYIRKARELDNDAEIYGIKLNIVSLLLGISYQALNILAKENEVQVIIHSLWHSNKK